MHQHDRRPGPLAVWLGHVDGQIGAVASLDPHEVGVRHLAPVDRGAGRPERDQRVVRTVVEEEQVGLAIGVRGHEHPLGAAAVRRIDPIDQSRQLRVDLGLQRLHGGIEPDRALRVGVVVDPQHLVRPIVLDQDGVDVESSGADDRLRLGPSRGRVVSIDRLRAVHARKPRGVDLSVGADGAQVDVVGAAFEGRELGAHLPRAGGVWREDRGLAAIGLHRCTHVPCAVQQPLEHMVRPDLAHVVERAGRRVHPHGGRAGPFGAIGVELVILRPVGDHDIAAAVVQHLVESVLVRIERACLDHRARLRVVPAEVDEHPDVAAVPADTVEPGAAHFIGRFGLVADAEDKRPGVSPTGSQDVELRKAGNHLESGQVLGIDHRQQAPAHLVAHENRHAGAVRGDQRLVHLIPVEERRSRHRRRWRDGRGRQAGHGRNDGRRQGGGENGTGKVLHDAASLLLVRRCALSIGARRCIRGLSCAAGPRPRVA